MSEQDELRLREEVRRLISRAAAQVITTPLTVPMRAGSPPAEADRSGLDAWIEEFAAAESQLSSFTADDDALLGKARSRLGALYATRCLRGGWAEEDKKASVRLLRAARASGYLNTDTDPVAMLLLAVMLMPGNMASRNPSSLDTLTSAIAFGAQLVGGGPVLEDLHELRAVLGEIVSARPDDPRVGPLIQFAEMLHQTLNLLQDLSNGAPITPDRLGMLFSVLAPDPSNQLGSIISALMSLGRELEAAPAPPQPLPAGRAADGPGGDDGSLPDKLALFVEMSVPGTIPPEDMPRLIERLEASGADGQAIAALGRLVYAMRTNDSRDLDLTVQKLREIVASPPSASTAWLARMVFPAVLAAAAMSHGNRQDDVEAAVQLGWDWSSLFPDAMSPGMDEPGVYGLSIGRAALDSNLRLSQARDDEDDEALEELVRELARAERTADSTSEWYFLVPFQRALAELNLAVRRQDAALLRRANHDLRAAFDAPVPPAVRPLMEAAWPTVLMASAILERQPAELTEAIRRARASLNHPPVTHDQPTFTRLSIALALKAQYALVDGPAKPAIMQEAIDELEQARNTLTERSGSKATNEILWQLAEAYWLRGDRELDDNRRAVAAALESLHVIAGDVLLQLGTEHGLSAAKAGAGRGLRAAGWALAGSLVEQAVECLERGRALVLQAAATAGTVPERLRAAGAEELAQQWEQSTPRRRPSSTRSIGESAPTLIAADDYISVPSDLRRRALEAMRRNEDSSDPRHELVAVPGISRLARHLDEAGVDALVYLLPETDTEGRAVVVWRDGTVRDLPLPGLSAAGRGPFERYLDTAAQRFARTRGEGGDRGDRDLAAVGPWRDSLDELCDWAGSAVLDELINALPFDPSPDAPARVVFVPCGTLGLVPWHAAKLSREPSGVGLTRPLRACDLLVISYAASAAELLRSLAREREPHSTDPVIVVDPSKTLPYAGSEAIAIRRAYLTGARLMGFVEGHQVEAPGTPDEVLALLTGHDGTAPASMLQITAHGTASTRPTASRLLLANPGEVALRESAGSDDGVGAQYLTVAEILDASRPGVSGRISSLVVLDCCDTDLINRDHDEALTLTTAFVARGATDAVGSRWSIDDWSSAVCMVVFHHYLAERKLAPADALRAAQLWMLGPDRERIPVLAQGLLEQMHSPLHAVSSWAPFIHQGNPRRNP